MRKILLLFCTVLFFSNYKSQETLPFYQQYLLEGDFLFNPALYGSTDDVVVNLNYQKQFSSFSESPNVQSIGMHANIIDRVGVGLGFFRDQNGPISSNGIFGGAAYFIPLDDEEDRKSQFSFGTSVNLYHMNVDLGMLQPRDPGDPLLENENIFLAYANIGMALSYRKFFAGVSVNDIALSNDIPIVNSIEPEPTKILLNAGYQWYLSEQIFVTPSMMVNLNTNSSKMVDLNLMATLMGDENSLSAGASFRTASNKFGSQNLGVSPIVKGTFNKFFFGATYNFGLSDIQQYGGSSFMLSLGYNIDNFINSRGFRY